MTQSAFKALMASLPSRPAGTRALLTDEEYEAMTPTQRAEALRYYTARPRGYAASGKARTPAERKRAERDRKRNQSKERL